MKIEHIAIWTKDIEETKNFYIKYFNGTANKKYINSKGFTSYFLTFDEGCRLEIMQMLGTKSTNFDTQLYYSGISHFAISVGSEEKVHSLTKKLQQDGYTILSEPRTTGDGYFESVVADPNNHRVEITV